MNTKTLTASLLMCLTLPTYAKTPVTMFDVKGHPRPNNSGITVIDSDEDHVTIKSESTIYNVDIVIKDQFGNVMYHSTQAIGPTETTISVPSYDDGAEKSSIDIRYEDTQMSGYFE